MWVCLMLLFIFENPLKSRPEEQIPPLFFRWEPLFAFTCHIVVEIDLLIASDNRFWKLINYYQKGFYLLKIFFRCHQLLFPKKWTHFFKFVMAGILKYSRFVFYATMVSNQNRTSIKEETWRLKVSGAFWHGVRSLTGDCCYGGFYF